MRSGPSSAAGTSSMKSTTPATTRTSAFRRCSMRAARAPMTGWSRSLTSVSPIMTRRAGPAIPGSARTMFRTGACREPRAPPSSLARDRLRDLGGDRLRPCADDLDAIGLTQVLGYRGLGQIGLSMQEAGHGVCEFGRHPHDVSGIVAVAVPEVRRDRRRADQNKGREHSELQSGWLGAPPGFIRRVVTLTSVRPTIFSGLNKQYVGQYAWHLYVDARAHQNCPRPGRPAWQTADQYSSSVER